MSSDSGGGVGLRIARRLARALVGPSFWPILDAELQDERAEREARGSPRWRTEVWAAVQYLSVAARLGIERARPLRFTQDRRSGMLGGGWALDLKQALRSLRVRPGTTATVVATVALAIGATTAVFSVVDGVLLRPLPYPESDRLARVWQTYSGWKDSPSSALRSIAEGFGPPAPMYFDWATSDTGFESLGAYRDAGFIVQGPDGAQVLRGQRATSGLFQALGIPPILGRSLMPADDAISAPRVVVLSESFRAERFEGRGEVIGAAVTIDGQPHTVVGVMPDGFGAPAEDLSDASIPAGAPQLWTPLTGNTRQGGTSLSVVGRLETGVSLEIAAERLAAVHAGLVAAGRDELGETGVRAEALLESVVGDVKATLWFLLAAVAMVLGVAVVNIANVLTASGMTRRRELAVRAALGAGPGRLVRGLLVESAVLTTLGGLAGIAMAWVSLPLLMQLAPPTVPRLDAVRLSGVVLLGGICATGLTALVVGTLPAVLTARSRPQEAMRGSSRSATSTPVARRVRSVLVVAEVSVAFVLLVGATLLATSFERLWTVERGFTTERLAIMSVVADPATHPTQEDRAQFRETLREALETIPGVTASAMNAVPLSGIGASSPLFLERGVSGTQEVAANVFVGLDNYMDVLGIAVVAGRGLSPQDTKDSPLVVVVNNTMARRYWPDATAIGKRLRITNETEAREIVGVATDVRQELETGVEPTVHIPASQAGRSTNQWVLRVQGDMASALQQGRAAVAALSPATPVRVVRVLDDVIADSVAAPRFRTLLIVGLAALSALLALLGVYGALAFSVSQRTKEIGIRMALGARAHSVVMDVVGSGLKLTLAGVALGLLLARTGSDLLRSFLFEVAPSDPLIYLAVVVGVVAVGCAAAYLPARQAATVDPVSVLNQD